MTPSPDLTLREAAELAGVTKTTVEKAVEAKVIRPLTRPARLRGGSTRYVPLQAVAFFAALKHANLVDLPVRLKKALWNGLVRLEPMQLAPVEFSPGTVLHLDEASQRTLRGGGALPGVAGCPYRVRPGNAWRHAGDTRHANHRVLGTGPLARWRKCGRPCMADNPDVPREAFEAAAIFARAHPLRGRPGGRPWRNTARRRP